MKKTLRIVQWLSIVWCGLALSWWSCSPSTGTGDGGTKDGSAKEGTTVQALGPLDKVLAAGEVRAGEIKKKSALLPGLDAAGVVGDWKIYNDKVAFVLHGLSQPRLWSRARGQVIDASPLDAKGKAAPDQLEEVFSLIGILRVLVATDIKLIEAGGPGKRAVIRVTGVDQGVPIIDALLKSAKLRSTWEIDYILEPGATHLTIVTRVKAPIREVKGLGDGLLLGDQTRQIADGVGWEYKKAAGKPILWFGSVGQSASYLYATADAKKALDIPLSQAAILPIYGDETKSSRQDKTYTRYLFVSAGSLDQNLQAWRGLLKRSTIVEYKGKVTGARTIQAVSIELQDTKSKRTVNQTRLDADGSFSIKAPAGDYTLVALAEGHLPISVPAKAGTAATLALVEPAIVTIKVTGKDLSGKDTGRLPARVEIKGPENRLINLIKQQEVALPPGEYTVTVSHGLTHDFVQEKISLTSKQSLTKQYTLQRAVDTKGYIGADMHLHSSPSIDSEVALPQRVASLAAEGVGFAVSSDHDVPVDYTPFVKALDLQNYLRTVIGQEVSPLSFHSNAFPVKRLADRSAYFSMGWGVYDKGVYQRTKSGPETWAGIRKDQNATIIQINHPRRGQAFLDTIKYDADTGLKALKPGLLDANWDSIEVYNGNGRDTFVKRVLWDWFSFLNQGWFKTAVGNSDSHDPGRRPGMPRTLIATPDDNPATLDPKAVIDNIKQNRAIVYAGPMIHALANGKAAPGARLTGKSIELKIKIEAPAWIAVSYVKLYANGKLVETFPVPASKERVRFEKMITRTPTKDTWYVILAGDDKTPMAPIYPGKLPISMTNPVLLDIDGKGFQTPGLVPAP